MVKISRVLLAALLACVCHMAATPQDAGGAPAGLAGINGGTSGFDRNMLLLPATDQHLPDWGRDNILVAEPFAELPPAQSGQPAPPQAVPLTDPTHQTGMPNGQTANPDNGPGNGTLGQPVGTPPPAAAPCPSGSQGPSCPPAQHPAAPQAHPQQPRSQ